LWKVPQALGLAPHAHAYEMAAERGMKAVILAGGMGTRLSEETEIRPKPMIEIGGMPILWHIMKIYSTHGVNDFVICLGYKGYVIKEYFANYHLHACDVTFDLGENRMEMHRSSVDPWRVTLIDTGENTMTGGRLRRALSYLDAGRRVLLHVRRWPRRRGHHELALLPSRAGRPRDHHGGPAAGRFGALEVEDDRVRGFREKPRGDGGWINGGFFVLSPEVARYLDGDDTVWEDEPLSRLAEDGELAFFEHQGFWQPMDTLRDKRHLQDLWDAGEAPWKVWA
jgi:glucose-1-phosphate cytidylyltransferase